MSNIPLRRGMYLRHQNHVLRVEDFSEHHSGKQRPTVHVSLRDIRDGRAVDRSLDDLLPVQEVEHAMRPVQYLYARGQQRVFMDAETFDEFEFSDAQLGGSAAFLVDGQEYRALYVDGAPAALEMPEIIAARVRTTADAGHSVGSAANVTKEAMLENGLEIRVPLFIRSGDLIRVDTRTRTYAGKEHA